MTDLIYIIFREHAKALSTRQAVRQSRKSRGFFDFFRRKPDLYKPTYNYQADGSACRVFGSVEVKKVTGKWSAFIHTL